MFKNNKKLIFILILIAIGGFLLLSPALGAPTKALDNPLGTTTDINTLIGKVIKGVLGIVGSLALLMIIYGGFTMLTSGGAEAKITKAKGIIVWAIIGLVVIFLSYAILNAVLGVLTSGSTSTSGTTSYSYLFMPKW